MTKKTSVALLIIVVVVAILSVTFMCADVSLVISGKKPIFSLEKATYEDGGTIEYMGLFYKIFDYNQMGGKDGVEFGTWFKTY